MLFLLFFLLFLPTSFHPRLQGGPELCDWPLHTTQRETIQWSVSPFPSSFLSCLPPFFHLSFTQLSNYHRADEGQKTVSCLEGLRDTGGAARWLTRSNTPSEEGDPEMQYPHFSFGMLCVCVCRETENAKMMYSIPVCEYLTISLFSFLKIFLFSYAFTYLAVPGLSHGMSNL